MAKRIAVLSDTHGLLRLEVLSAISGSWNNTSRSRTEKTIDAKGSIALRILASWGSMYLVLET